MFSVNIDQIIFDHDKQVSKFSFEYLVILTAILLGYNNNKFPNLPAFYNH